MYCSPGTAKKKSLWITLIDILPPDPLPWLILGDFNAILSPKDKKKVIAPWVRDVNFLVILLMLAIYRT